MNMGSLFTFVAAVLIVVAVHHEDPATAKSYAQTGARLAIGATYFGVASSVITIARVLLMRCTGSVMTARLVDPDGVQAALISTDVVELMDMASHAPPTLVAWDAEEGRPADGAVDRCDVRPGEAAVDAAADADAAAMSFDLDLDAASSHGGDKIPDPRDEVDAATPAAAAAAVPAAPTMTEDDAELLFGVLDSDGAGDDDGHEGTVNNTAASELDALLFAPGPAPTTVQYDEHGVAVVAEHEALRAGIEALKRPDAFARFVAGQ
jgi:hypothetical protein